MGFTAPVRGQFGERPVLAGRTESTGALSLRLTIGQVCPGQGALQPARVGAPIVGGRPWPSIAVAMPAIRASEGRIRRRQGRSRTI